MVRCKKFIKASWLVPLLSILGGIAVGVTTRIPLNLQSFNAGELSPLMNARSDFPKYHSGAKTLQNMLVRSQGPIQRRPGTRYIASVKDPNYAPRLLSFIYSTSDAYVIEMGHLYARFYRTNPTTGIGGQILDPNNDPYEIVTPYDGNDVFEIQVTQDAQYMRLVHPDYQPQKLTRTGHAAWTITPIDFSNGPFLPENKDTSLTITPSVTGAYSGIDYYNTGDTGGKIFYSTAWLAQTFTAASSYTAAGVQVKLYKLGNPSTITVSLRATAAGLPTGADLVSGTINGNLLTTSTGGEWKQITFSSTQAITSGTVYAVVVRATGASYPTSAAYWRLDSTSPTYAGGSYIHSSNSGSSWTAYTAGDFMFGGVDSNTPANSITLTATGPIFDVNHVDSLWQLRQLVDTSSIQGSWSQVLAVDQNSATVTVYEGQQYSAVTSGTWYGVLTVERSYDNGTTWETVGEPFQSRYSANMQLTGTENEDEALYRLHWARGEQYDGRSDKYMMHYTLASLSYWRPAVVKITAYTDPCTVTASAIDELAGTTATYKWSEGAWSTYRGWPRTVEHHEQRCVYGGTESYPQTIWASIIAGEDSDYDDFDAGQIVTESDAWTYVLPGMSPIQWLKSQDYLMVGTTESIGRLGTADKPINPTWPATYRVQAKIGAAYMQPIHALDNILYVERGAKKVREIGYTYASERYVADDMTILAEHITGDGIIQVAFQTRPDPILWAVRDDGVLLSFTYNPRHEVGAWAEQITDGDFNSVAVTPGPISEDDVYSVISRSINSATVRYVEQFTPLTLPSDQNDYFFVDCGLNAITGLSHLEGETVSLWANGRPIASQHGTGNAFVVASGAMDPNDPNLTEYTVGLPFTSVYESMPIVAESQGVSSALMKTAVLSVNLDLQDAMTLNIGRDSTNKSQVVFSEDSWATTIAPFTGIKSVSFPRGISRDMTIYLDANEPGPVTVRSISPTVEVASD